MWGEKQTMSKEPKKTIQVKQKQPRKSRQYQTGHSFLPYNSM